MGNCCSSVESKRYKPIFLAMMGVLFWPFPLEILHEFSLLSGSSEILFQFNACWFFALVLFIENLCIFRVVGITLWSLSLENCSLSYFDKIYSSHILCWNKVKSSWQIIIMKWILKVLSLELLSGSWAYANFFHFFLFLSAVYFQKNRRYLLMWSKKVGSTHLVG